MKVFGKPKNRWGWFRVAAVVGLAGVAAWTLAAAGLRGTGTVSWMAWSGYSTFSWLRGLELGLVALAAAVIAGWFEEHEQQREIERIRHLEAEQSRALQREAAVRRFQETITAVLGAAAQDPSEPRARVRQKITQIVQSCLRDLDGKGKGEVLRFLFEQSLLCREGDVIELGGEDFSGAVLTNARLGGICLERLDLTQARLNGADLEKSRLSGAILRKAILRQADLRGAELNESNLRGAYLDDANLEGADLRGAFLDGAFLKNTNLKDCLMDGFPAGETPPGKAEKGGRPRRLPATLDKAVLIDTVLPDGRKLTNDKGEKYLRDKELSILVDKL